MKPSNTVEAKRLVKVDAVIDSQMVGVQATDRPELRLQLLEATASRLGGFDLEAFQNVFSIKAVRPARLLVENARLIVKSIDNCGIHPALALSALARENLDEGDRKKSGAYHTDFRLALHLANSHKACIRPDMKVIDPACGAGILLAAVSVVACGSDRILASEWMRNCVFAADLSPLALRGTLIALAALTDDLGALQEMRAKWRVQDSLLAPDSRWSALAPDGFDLVIANPPWEKVKLSRHEFSKANGERRNYGTSYRKGSLEGYEAAKTTQAQLAFRLVEKYPSLSAGEPDLYVAFTELLLRLTRAGGSGALIVPAGLIRSLNTMYLRRELMTSSEKLAFTVMDNRARHFAIDTRFKFLLVSYVKATTTDRSCKKIGVAHASANADAVCSSASVELPISIIEKLRPDLTIPEVRSAEEWRIFKKMQGRGVSLECSQSPWYPAFCREVDMTHGKKYFSNAQNADSIPVIEGRMVQPYRLGCKSYASGEGRSAVWHNVAPGRSAIVPQFWMPVSALSKQATDRSQQIRAGFCDITGQTNERSMMATLVPKNVVCGNKVPTVAFPNDPSEERILLWLSIVNSLPFDWLLRRIVTTTVNYFVLLSIKLPALEIDSLPARKLIEISRKLSQLDSCNHTSFEVCWRIARLKAEADVLVANAYGCSEADLSLIVKDFPLLDRGQPALPGESRSTVTADLLLQEWSRRKQKDKNRHSTRLSEAVKLGAIAYLSSEFATSITNACEGAYEQY